MYTMTNCITLRLTSLNIKSLSEANTYYKLFNPEGELCFNLYDLETNACYELYNMEAETEGCYKLTYLLITLRLCNASADAYFLN